jgi:hypothetical protein
MKVEANTNAIFVSGSHQNDQNGVLSEPEFLNLHV